jgi:predicted transcriptional regulator
MIDGKPYMSLARHLKSHGLTPDEYRQRYGLKPDYPMVAPAYSQARRAMALRIGLGGKAAAARAAAAAGNGAGNSRGQEKGRKAGRARSSSAEAG